MVNNEFLNAAIDYASRGLAVFPVKPRGKDPLTTHGVHDATTNFDQIKKWWKRSPNANIGIACGQVSGGIVVIDLDRKPNGVDGLDTLNEWERENGELPETVRAITGSGGYHLFYKSDLRGSNHVGLLDGIDIRSDGGYIIAPPSVHPNGRRYEWENDPDEYEMAPANETVMKLLSLGKKVKPDKFVMPEKVGEGKRNDTIYKLACSLQAKGLPDSTILIACADVNAKQCDPPLDDDELERIVTSAIQYDKGVVAIPKAAKELDLLYVTDSKGNEKIRQCAENVARVLLNDPKIANKIKDDTFGHRLLYLGQLDWRAEGDTYGDWTDKDDAALRAYLDVQYGLRNRADYDDGFNMALLENQYNPLVGYLNALEWDGTPRIDTVMTDYLGVEPTEYNLAAFRVFLQGAIHRAYEPGCQFDYMLVFIGNQGDGKSTFFRLLACNDEWSDDNFNFKDTGSKSTVEHMAGKWILEMGEMDTMKKDRVTADELKAFITQKADTYRVPFSKRPERRPRQCVFSGTSNDRNFLKDRTGNRRYLPVDCYATEETKAKIFDYKNSRPFFQQVMAEAVAYYKAHPDEPPVMPRHLTEATMAAQADHLEEDAWTSIIEEYLNSTTRDRVNASCIWVEGFDKPQADLKRAESNRIITIMRFDIKGWHEVGKARCNGFGNRGICFDRNKAPLFEEVPPDEAIPF